jgi:hypothetical protein
VDKGARHPGLEIIHFRDGSKAEVTSAPLFDSCRRSHPTMLFAKIIVVQGKTRLAPEIDQRDAKRNQRTHEQ